MRKIQEETKPEKCILCGKEQTSFCNSHSVPKMVLKNIAKAGKLYHANKLIEIPVVDKEKGISNIKLFESIVTVEGEDFLNSREEKECYKLVRESTKFIYDRLEEFSKYNCKTASDELNRHMRNMFKNMRSSLKEEVGSIKKDFL